ncbi:rhodanese-like domain-containing protein [Marinilabiliaceae bacterium ANBcel2]|nr:rhodanese-like domain-containing protein [Marinilabiliaceae bacterium ANBcel2]
MAKVSLFFCLVICFSKEVEKLDCESYYDLLNRVDQYIILDTRLKDQYNFERIPSAYWAGDKETLDSIVKKLSLQTNIFIYCDYGDRTVEVYEILRDNYGFENIYDLDKGFEEWKYQNYPVDTLLIE